MFMAANDRPQPGDEQQPKPLAGRVGQGREQRAESGKDAGGARSPSGIERGDPAIAGDANEPVRRQQQARFEERDAELGGVQR